MAARLREGLVRRRPARLTRRRVEEAVHARDPGRCDAGFGVPEGLGVEGDFGIGADDRVRVVLVHPRIRAGTPGLADPAVADGLEGAPGVPQLDDPDVGVVDAVDDRLVVVDDDDVGAGEQPRQADPIGEAPPLGTLDLNSVSSSYSRSEPALDHLVVHDLEVAAELRARVGAEQDPPAVPARDRPKEPEQRAEQADAELPEGAEDPVQRRWRDRDGRRASSTERVTCSDIEPSPGSTDGTARNSPRSSVKAPASRAGSTDPGSAMTTGVAAPSAVPLRTRRHRPGARGIWPGPCITLNRSRM